MKKTKTIDNLIKENEELHARLTESEETLDAICKGEVDAIVISGTKGEQVYSISSAETPYRTFLEEMHEGAITLTLEGLILYCNKRFATLINQPVERVTGSYFNSLISSDGRSEFDKLLAQMTVERDDVLIVSLNNSIYLKLAFRLLPPDIEGGNCILIATDITEIKKKENELLELQYLLEKKLGIIERLRMELICNKIDDQAEKTRLVNTNKKLVKEIARHKLIEAEMNQTQKLKPNTELKMVL